MESVWQVSKLSYSVESTESVGSRSELYIVATCVHTADADETQLESRHLSRVGVGGVYLA